MNTGIQLGSAIVAGRQSRAIAEANALLADMQSMVPQLQTKSGIPEKNAPAGNQWDAMKNRYVDTLKNITDPNAMEAMLDALAKLEQKKILEYGTMATAALRGGDPEAAQNYIAGLTYFLSPDDTPQVKVTEDGKVLIASPSGKPMVLDANGVEDLLHSVVDFGDYRQLAFDRKKHEDMMTHYDKQLAVEAAYKAAQLDLAKQRTGADVARSQAQTAESEARMRKIDAEIEQADRKFKAGVQKARVERRDEQVKGAMDYINTMLKDAGEVSPTDAGGADPLSSDVALEGLSEAERAIVERNKAASVINDSATLQQQADLRAKQAALRNAIYGDDGRSIERLQTFSEAIASGNPEMSPERVGALGLRVLLSDARTGNDVVVDPKRAELVFENPAGGVDQRVRIAPAYVAPLAALLGVVQEQPQQAALQQAAPQQAAPQQAAPQQGAIPVE